MRSSRLVLSACAALLACAFALPARAQGYPEKMITFVVPFTAGAAPDVLVRAIARELSKETGVQTIVENKPGASSMLAAQAVAKAVPDGYTVLVTGNVAVTGNPHVFKKISYDPAVDFTPITPVAKGPMYLYVNPRKVPASSTGELVRLLKKEPGKYTFAYTSITSRLPAEVLQQETGVQIVGVPYRSGNAAMPDLISGQVDMLFTDFSGWPHVSSGKLKVLGVTDRKRSEFAPELPTFEEAGLKKMDITFWLGAYLPAKAPAPVVGKLHALLSRATQSPEVKSAHQNGGTYAFTLPPGELDKFQTQESATWGQIIRDAGIQPE